jgi:uncharacterized protein YndB with AHSA1/START domain
MTDPSVIHSTFTLERVYPAPTVRVFAAWADPASKARWFAGPTGRHELDFRVGGQEVNRVHNQGGQAMAFESRYHDIVDGRRIVYTSTLSVDDAVVTVSLTTVELAPEGDTTRLTLTEHGAFLDGHEQPEWRAEGTGKWLDALGAELAQHEITPT